MGGRLIDADELIELIGDDMATLNFIDMSREGHDVCLCTLQMITQYIKALPAVETVPLEDYRSMEQTVHKLTQAIAEPIKHGRWLPSDKGDCTYTCSECGFVRDAYILEEKAYCPRCGADMREVENGKTY